MREAEERKDVHKSTCNSLAYEISDITYIYIYSFFMQCVPQRRIKRNLYVDVSKIICVYNYIYILFMYNYIHC